MLTDHGSENIFLVQLQVVTRGRGATPLDLMTVEAIVEYFDQIVQNYVRNDNNLRALCKPGNEYNFQAICEEFCVAGIVSENDAGFFLSFIAAECTAHRWVC